MSHLEIYLKSSAQVIEDTITHLASEKVEEVIKVVVENLKQKRPLLVCGNGGSAADAMHIAGELVARFKLDRPGLNVISLNDNMSTLTAWSNDCSYDTVFARQVDAYGKNGGVLLGISTSGNSKNIIEAFKIAKNMGVQTVAMTGKDGGKLADMADYLIDVPSKNTALIQQVHICLYHYMCEQIEIAFSTADLF